MSEVDIIDYTDQEKIKTLKKEINNTHRQKSAYLY